MKIRSIWNGVLKLSLVQIPIRVHTAINNSDQVKFNQLHKGCHQRLRQKLVCPVHGEVEREQIVKGYEYEKDHYCVVGESDLGQVRLETTGAIDLIQFVHLEELDLASLDVPYYLTPGGPVAEEGFCVLREALRRSSRIGLGRVVLSGKERLVALKPVGNGLMFFTLRYSAEIRSTASYFDALPNQVDQDQLALAQRLIESRSAPLDLSQFSDRYQTGLMEMIKARIAGRVGTETAPVASASGNIISLLDALKQSVAEVPPGKRSEKLSKRRKISA